MVSFVSQNLTELRKNRPTPLHLRPKRRTCVQGRMDCSVGKTQEWKRSRMLEKTRSKRLVSIQSLFMCVGSQQSCDMSDWSTQSFRVMPLTLVVSLESHSRCLTLKSQEYSTRGSSVGKEDIDPDWGTGRKGRKRSFSFLSSSYDLSCSSFGSERRSSLKVASSDIYCNLECLPMCSLCGMKMLFRQV